MSEKSPNYLVRNIFVGMTQRYKTKGDEHIFYHNLSRNPLCYDEKYIDFKNYFSSTK